MTHYWLWQGMAGGQGRTFLFVVENDIYDWMKQNADDSGHIPQMEDVAAIYIRKNYSTHHNWGLVDRISEVTYRVFTEATNPERGVIVVHLSPEDLEV